MVVHYHFDRIVENLNQYRIVTQLAQFETWLRLLECHSISFIPQSPDHPRPQNGNLAQSLYPNLQCKIFSARFVVYDKS